MKRVRSLLLLTLAALVACGGADGDPQVLRIGSIPDQAALHSILTKIRDLGVPLIAVNCLDPESRA